MMGTSMPATPTPAPGAAAASTGAPQATAPREGANARAARDDGQPDTGAGLFDLLLTQPLPAASGAPATTSRPAADDEERAPAMDARDTAASPLLAVLAQVLPQQPAPAKPTQVAGTAGAAIQAGAALPAAIAPTQPQSPQTVAPASANDGAVPTLAIAADAANTSASPAPASGTPADALPPAIDLPRPGTAAPDTQPVVAAPVVHAAATHAATPAGATLPASPQPLPQPADPSAGYDDSFGAQVTWLAEQRIGEAQIRISPEHLGAIDIRLQLDGKDVRAEFHSAQPEVRQALEASLPRLRDMLGQHGLQLAHAGVGQGQKQQRDGTPFAPATGTASHDDSDPVPPPGFRRARGLVDVYA